LDTMVGFSDPAAAKKLEESLRAAGGTDSAVFMYPGVGHAFMNSLPEPFESFEARKDAMGVVPPSEEQTALAWKRLLEFFAKHLKP
jgi:carboxymethylenebutenolidase